MTQPPGTLYFPIWAVRTDDAGNDQPGYWHNNLWYPVGAYLAPYRGVSNNTQAFPGSANINTYVSLPTPLAADVSLAGAESWLCLSVLSAYVDTVNNNTEVALALNVTGATSIPAGSRPEARLHLLGKTPIAVTVSHQTTDILGPGISHVELMAAGNACNLSNVAFSVTPLAALRP